MNISFSKASLHDESGNYGRKLEGKEREKGKGRKEETEKTERRI